MLGDRIFIQKDFNRLQRQAENKMKVTEDKCKILDLGPRNQVSKEGEEDMT